MPRASRADDHSTTRVFRVKTVSLGSLARILKIKKTGMKKTCEREMDFSPKSPLFVMGARRTGTEVLTERQPSLWEVSHWQELQEEAVVVMKWQDYSVKTNLHHSVSVLNKLSLYSPKVLPTEPASLIYAVYHFHRHHSRLWIHRS